MLQQAARGAQAQQYSGKTTFSVIARFEDVNKDKKIHTEQFLKACYDLSTVLDNLGTGFSIAKKDMQGNIKKIERLNKDPKMYVTLNAMLEEDSHEQKKPTNTAVGLIWLKRGLEFLAAFIQGLSKEHHDKVQEENLRPTVLKAYEGSLKRYHGTMTQFMISNIARLVPARKDFLKALKVDTDATDDTVISDIDLYIPDLLNNIGLVEELLNSYDLNTKQGVA